MTKKYALKLKEETIEIGEQTFILREMSGVLRDLYMQDFSTRVDSFTGPDGKDKIKLKNQVGFQSKLISLSLFTTEGKPVEQATIDSWPALTVQALFKDAQEISGISTKEEAELKKA